MKWTFSPTRDRHDPGQESHITESHITESSASLYTDDESNPRDIVLGEEEKNSFIVLLEKGRNTGLLPQKTTCLNSRELDEGFYNSGSKMGVSDKIKVWALLLVSLQVVCLLIFFGLLNLTTDDLLTGPALINSLSWNSGKVIMTGVLPTRDREEKGLQAWEPHRPPAWFQSYVSEVGNEEECNSDL